MTARSDNWQPRVRMPGRSSWAPHLHGHLHMVGPTTFTIRALAGKTQEASTSTAENLVVAESDGRAAAMRVTWWGAGTNISLAALKYAAGCLTGSSALVADAAHSLSDLLSDIITLFVVDAARLPPDEDHPYGHGRFEAVGSLSVAVVLVATAGGVGWSSAGTLLDWWCGSAFESGLAESGYGSLAVSACIISLVAKEALYHATVRVGNDIGSQTLIANAWHHRSDAFSSVAALLGVGGSLAGVPWLDPMAGVLVSGLVAKAGIEIGWEAIGEVTEKAVPDDETLMAVQRAAASTTGVTSIDRLRTRRMGPYALVDLHACVDPCISVSAAHNVARHLSHQIKMSARGISEVLIHIVPERHPGTTASSSALLRPHVDVEREVRVALERIPEIHGVSHVITHYVANAGIHLKVDIVCDDSITIKSASGIARKAKHILEELQDVTSVDVDLELQV